MRASLFYDFYRRQLFSKPVRVIVTEPVGTDREAWTFIRTHALARFLGPEVGLFPADGAVVLRLRELTQTLAASRYAPHAAIRLEAICAPSGTLARVVPGCPPPVTCAGDCDSGGHVTRAEIGTSTPALFDRNACPAADRDRDGRVRANNLAGVVCNAIVVCGSQAQQ